MPDQRETLVRKMIEEGTSDDDIRATLKAFDVSPVRKPISAEDFMRPEDIANRDNGTSIAGDIIKGAAKGLGRSVAGMAELAGQGGTIPGVIPGSLFNPVLRHPLFQRAEEALAPTNDAQRVGGYMETAAEVAPGAIGLAKSVPALARGAVSMAKSAGGMAPAAFDAATHLVPGGGYIRGARRLLAAAIDNGATAAPSAANKGGRLVTPPARTAFSDELASVLDELRAPEMPPVELPPPAALPPGYAPRATVPAQARPGATRAPAAPQAAPAPIPQAAIAEQLSASLAEQRPSVAIKPRQVKMAGPIAPEPKRAYFLKSPEEILAGKIKPAAVTPSGSIAVEDLPASWQSRVGQDLFPTTGEDATAMTAALREEIKSRGLTIGQAIAAISKNKDIPTKLRSQMVRALVGGSN